MYNLVYTNRAVKDIKKLPPDIKKRIGKTLLRYQQDPLGYSETLTDARLGQNIFTPPIPPEVFLLPGHVYPYPFFVY